MELKQLFTFAAACSLALSVSAQDRVHYTGTELSNPTCHDGQLSPVVRGTQYSGDACQPGTSCTR